MQDVQYAKRQQAAKHLIKTEQIEVMDAQLSLGIVPEITASVINNSPYDLDELTLRVTVIDCKNPFDDLIPEASGAHPSSSAGPKHHCAVVGQTLAHDYGLSIPTGQKRAFRAFAHFDNMPALKEWSWHFNITEVVAKH